MASKLAQAVKDLSTIGQKLKASWVKGRWQQPEISARLKAKIRQTVLLSGGEWPYEPTRKPEKTRMKGHKHDRLAAERRQRTKELMDKMPSILQEWKKRKAEAKLKASPKPLK